MYVCITGGTQHNIWSYTCTTSGTWRDECVNSEKWYHQAEG